MGQIAMRTKPAAGVVLALSAVLALAGCSGPSGTGTSGFPQGDGAAIRVSAGQRGEPVNLKGTTLDGTPLDIASLRGQTVVLNVWGSWCAPCRKEAPALVQAAQQLAGSKVAFVGINTRDGVAQAQAFEADHNITYPSLRDNGGTLILALGRAVPPKAIPSTLVLDPQGRIAARFNGAITTTTLIDLVEDVTGTSIATPDATATS